MERVLEVEELKDKYFGGIKSEAKCSLEKLIKSNAIAPSDVWVKGTEIYGSCFSRGYGEKLKIFRGLVRAGVLERRGKHPFEYRVADSKLAQEVLDHKRRR